MKYFSKFISNRVLKIFLCTAMLFHTAAYCFAEEVLEASEEMSEAAAAADYSAYNKLRSMELAEETEEEKLTLPVTKAEFCKLITEFADLSEDVVNYEEPSPFSDVNRLTDSYKYIYAANAYGLVKGEPGAELRPDEFVDELFAKVVLVRLLGYEVTAEYKGGYPAGYIMLGERLRLTKGIVSDGDALLLQEVYQMLCNTLEANVYEQTIYGAVDKYEQGKTYAGETFEIYFENGVMEQNTVTSVYRPLDDSTNDTITVGEKLLKSSTDKYNSFLGMKVRAWYKEINGRDTVIYVEEAEPDETDSIRISGDCITKASGGSVTYESSNGKLRTINISYTPNIIYNGVFYSGYGDLSDLMKKSDEVTFVRASVGDYDVIKINKYTHGLVNVVDKDNKSILIRDGSPISADFDGCFGGIYDAEGNAISLEDLKSDFVVSVLVSKNSKGIKYTAVYVSDDCLKAKLDRIKGGDTYIFGERELKKADSFTEDLDVGSNYVVYIGLGEKIVYAERDLQDSYRYGILVKSKCDPDGIDSKTEMKVFTQEGKMEVLTAADNVEIDGKAYKIDKNGAELKTAVDAFSIDMPIAYKLNAGGRVLEILTPDGISGSPDDGMVKLVSSTSYTFSNYNIDLACMYTADTVIFNIPDASNTGSEKRYKVMKSIIEGLSKLEAYKINNSRIPIADMVILTSAGNVRAKVEDYDGNISRFGVVTEVVEALDNDGYVVPNIVVSDGTERQYSVENEDFLTDTPLKTGDVIYYMVSPTDTESITDFTLIYRDGDSSNGYLIPGVNHDRTYSASANIDFILGEVEYTDGKYVLYKTWDDNNSFAEVKRVVPLGTAKVCKYDTEKQEVYGTDYNDLIDGKKLIIKRGYKGVTECFVVFD